AILGIDGRSPIGPMIAAGQGRITGMPYGTYDYSASVGIAAAYQSLEHPSADFAKAVMQASAAGTGVRLSDGSTNIMPVGEGRDGLGVGLRPPISVPRVFARARPLPPPHRPGRAAPPSPSSRPPREPATRRPAASGGGGTAHTAAIPAPLHVDPPPSDAPLRC